ncbi:MAG: UDP-glucose 4-epimerase GalE [Calditrichaeota bacterium]|nr:MAG: UDP-glucose 4-epimerase GalE [Calditrichota bacterium]MBL1205602.1 UDP-glucose 4-epimerase GalE [Calditrichota bacterium]NOG45430.1 UDP-glucose 4-epimerase GalE [Calditrichota bacterium]
MSNIKNVLVTGGAGYIGSHIVQQLCDEGFSVTVFDNFSLGLQENIDTRVAEVIKGDIISDGDLKKAFAKGIDVVFHFAAWKAAGESMADPAKYAKNNISGTINLLNTMLANNTKHIVFSSSAAVYGNPQYLPIDEKHPLDPTNYYGYTKLCIEQNLAWYSRLKNIRYSALRYFNATGYDISGKIRGKEKNPANLSPIVMEVACGMRKNMLVFGDDYDTKDGTCIRDYIHVNDLATAHISAMKYICEKDENLTVNLGTGNGNSVFDVIKSAEKVVGIKLDFEITGRRPGDPAELVASSDKALKLLNWKAKHSDLETIFKTMKPVYL